MGIFKKLITYMTVFAFFFTQTSFAYAQMLGPKSFDALYGLANDGNLTAIKYAQKRGLNINSINRYGNTGICEAILNGDYRAYNTFYVAGANPKPSCLNNINPARYQSFMSSRFVIPVRDAITYTPGLVETSSSLWAWGLGLAVIGGGAAIALSGGGSDTVVTETTEGSCSPNPCANGTCSLDTFYPNGYLCNCPSDEAFDGSTCVPQTADACTPNPCGTGGCILDPTEATGYICNCPSGTTSNGITCVATDVCSPDPCGGGTCSVDSTSSKGYTCTNCPAGSIFDGTTCNASASPCASSPCNGGSCVVDSSAANGYICTGCPTDTYFNGTSCVPDGCATDPCGQNAICSTLSSNQASYICTCNSGYVDDGSGNNCVLDRCSSNPCNGGTCSNTSLSSTGYICSNCPAGTYYNGTTCATDGCAGNTCGGNGTCVLDPNNAAIGTCNCNTGFVLDNGTCIADKCATDPCGGGGCINDASNANGYICSNCPTGTYYDGTSCVQDGCYGNACGGNGTCLLDPSDPSIGICNCNPGYVLESGLCIEDFCATSPCSPNGTCSIDLSNVTGYACACNAGYYFYNQTSCEIDHCASDPCGSGATCTIDTTDITKYNCSCPTGTIFDGTTCVEDGCYGNTCGGNGTCERDPNDPSIGTCSCDPGYILESNMCIEDYCATSPCSPNGTCSIDITNMTGYACACNAGYFFYNQTSCEIDPCASNPCGSGATCTINTTDITKYNCSCPSNTIFDGTTCKSVTTNTTAINISGYASTSDGLTTKNLMEAIGTSSPMIVNDGSIISTQTGYVNAFCGSPGSGCDKTEHDLTVYGMYSSENTAINNGTISLYAGTLIAEDNNGSDAIYASADTKAYGMYGYRSKITNNGTITIDQSHIPQAGSGSNSGYGYGMFGVSSDIINNGNIEMILDGSTVLESYGMYGVVNSNIVNNKDATITMTALYADPSGDIAGIYANSSTVSNYGTIEMDLQGGTGILAENSSTVYNEGTIIVSGTSTTGLSTARQHFIELDATSSFVNSGVVMASAGLDLDTFAGDGTLVITHGSQMIAEEGDITGSAVVSSSVILEEQKDTYTISNAFSAQNVDVELYSESVFFSTKTIENEASVDIQLERIGFSEVVDNASTANYLEAAYTSGFDMFGSIMTMSSRSSANKAVNDALGISFISNFAQQNMDLLKSINNNLELNIAKQQDFTKDENLISGYFNYNSESGQSDFYNAYTDNASSLYAFIDKKYSNNARYGFGATITQFDSSYDSGSERNEDIFQLYGVFSYKFDDYIFTTMPNIGIGIGEYERSLAPNTYKADTTNYYYGVSNVLKKSIAFKNNYKIEPMLAFNITGMYQSETKEDNQLIIDAQNNFSAELGLGLFGSKDIEFSQERMLRLRAGIAYYYELMSNPHKSSTASIQGVSGQYAIDPRRGDLDRQAINASVAYTHKNIDITASFAKYINGNEDDGYSISVDAQYNFQ